MEIRKATLEDINEIMKVEDSSFIPEIQEDKEVFIERIKRCPSLFLVFEEGKSVAGYLSAELMNHIPSTASELKLGHIPENIQEDKNAYVYISSFAILPEYRGNGRGKQMWQKCVEYFEKEMAITHFLLLVNEEWSGAFHIYEKSGFKVIKEFPSFFFSNEKGMSKGILMEK